MTLRIHSPNKLTRCFSIMMLWHYDICNTANFFKYIPVLKYFKESQCCSLNISVAQMFELWVPAGCGLALSLSKLFFCAGNLSWGPDPSGVRQPTNLQMECLGSESCTRFWGRAGVRNWNSLPTERERTSWALGPFPPLQTQPSVRKAFLY